MGGGDSRKVSRLAPPAVLSYRHKVVGETYQILCAAAKPSHPRWLPCGKDDWKYGRTREKLAYNHLRVLNDPEPRRGRRRREGRGQNAGGGASLGRVSMAYVVVDDCRIVAQFGMHVYSKPLSTKYTNGRG